MKILYNITFALSFEQEELFIDYIKRVYIPEVLASKVLSEPRLGRVEADKADGVSYALQVVATSREDLELFVSERGTEIVQGLLSVLGGELVGFSTIMELVDLD